MTTTLIDDELFDGEKHDVFAYRGPKEGEWVLWGGRVRRVPPGRGLFNNGTWPIIQPRESGVALVGPVRDQSRGIRFRIWCAWVAIWFWVWKRTPAGRQAVASIKETRTRVEEVFKP